ncbi:hypothetical protein C8R48DRAFT_597834 [Suillus tomentosus]|nr:hypothetical protein C8R48DRAFT_597834 [Suillus tomentosus]
MLVLNKSSTCDVCMEGYMTGRNSPHSIPCGHVFCQKCLGHLLRHTCPLCRTRFSPQDVRRLHIDDMQSPMFMTASIEEVPETPEYSSPPPDNEARTFSFFSFSFSSFSFLSLLLCVLLFIFRGRWSSR